MTPPPLCAVEIQLGVRRVLRSFQAWPPPSPSGGDARAPRTTRTRGVVTRGLDGHPVVGNLDTIVGCLPKSEHTGRGTSRASASKRAQTVPGNGGLPESTATHLGWMAVGHRPCVWTAKHLRDDPPASDAHGTALRSASIRSPPLFQQPRSSAAFERFRRVRYVHHVYRFRRPSPPSPASPHSPSNGGRRTNYNTLPLR